MSQRPLALVGLLVMDLLIIGTLGCRGDSPAVDPATIAAPDVPSLRVGVWILAEGSHRTLEDPAKIEQLLSDAEAAGITDLFLQLFRAGKSWYASESANTAPYQTLLKVHGVDPLPAFIEAAHERGIRVHAWFNALSVATNRSAPVLAAVGEEAVLVDREGRSLLSYPKLDYGVPERFHRRMGTPGIWLDPAVPGVIEHLERSVDELAKALPELDGLHLDFIRHPMVLPIVPGSRFDVGMDFGYGQTSKDRFEKETGQTFKRGDAWDRFRRDRVTEVVSRLKARLPEGWALSAAVLPWADRAYLSAMQDWRAWLEEDLLDFAVAMAYSRDDRLLGYVSQGLRGGVGGDRVWMGLGSWLFAEKKPAGVQAQIDIALQSRPAGVVLFSYDALADQSELLRSLRWQLP